MTCIFCSIVSGDVSSRIVSENDNALAFMDAFPLTLGHVLVIPKEHRAKIQDMTPPEVSDVFSLAAKLVSRTDSLAGSTLLAIHNGPGAGQEIPHVHVHLVPRYHNDGAGAIHGMFRKTTHSEKDTIKAFEKMRN